MRSVAANLGCHLCSLAYSQLLPSPLPATVSEPVTDLDRPACELPSYSGHLPPSEACGRRAHLRGRSQACPAGLPDCCPGTRSAPVPLRPLQADPPAWDFVSVADAPEKPQGHSGNQGCAGWSGHSLRPHPSPRPAAVPQGPGQSRGPRPLLPPHSFLPEGRAPWKTPASEPVLGPADRPALLPPTSLLTAPRPRPLPTPRPLLFPSVPTHPGNDQTHHHSHVSSWVVHVPTSVAQIQPSSPSPSSVLGKFFECFF